MNCPGCSAMLPDNTSACLQCGAPQSPAPPTESLGPTRQRRRSPSGLRIPVTRGLFIVTTALALQSAFLILCAVLALASKAGTGELVFSQLTMAIDVIATVFGFVTFVFFAAWLDRASSNLVALGFVGQTFSPTWAILYWFIPIANLFRPYAVIREIFLASDPTLPVRASPRLIRRRRTPLVGAWWLCLIGSLFLPVLFLVFAGFVLRLRVAGDGGSSLIYAALAIRSVLTCIAAILMCRIVNAISSRQDRRAAELALRAMRVDR